MRAAGILVVRGDGKVLAFQKHSDKGLSIPCGKIVESDWSISDAAEREACEETMCDIMTYDNRRIFYDTDDRGNEVYTFLGRIVQGSPKPTTEGVPQWVDPRELLCGEYPVYNRKMLKFFGVINGAEPCRQIHSLDRSQPSGAQQP